MVTLNMRRPKISLKKYFYFITFFALLLIFGFNLRERELWKSKIPSQQQQHQQQLQQQQQESVAQTNAESGEDAEADESLNIENVVEQNEKIGIVTSTIFTNSHHQENHHHQQNNKNENSNSNIENEFSAETAGAGAVAGAFFPSTSILNVQSTARPWFFKNGEYYPKPAAAPSDQQQHKRNRKKKHHSHFGPKLFPYQDPQSDRIINQLMFVPHNYEQIRESGKLKTILLYNGLGPWNVKQGRDVFLRAKCPVDTCELTANRDRAATADMILYKDHFIPAGVRRPAHSKQVTMLYYLECPYHTQNVKGSDVINWTATYRRDSDIVAPYEKWQYYDEKIHQIEQDRNYAANKTKKVAWFVSNCGARNGRLQYAHDLQKFIDVDIYGACGTYKCPRITADHCFEILDKDYKFYLGFENSNCKDYITEKFFVNALNRNILPIVMGARPEDYEVSAPHRSYIHVDEFSSPRELAEYLHILDKNDDLYNSYFKWKGTGEFINTYFWCRVCAALHDEESLRKPRWYTDINNWWRGPGVCTTGSWRNFKARKDIIKDDD